MAITERKFDLDAVKDCLLRLGIPFELEGGSTGQQYAFKSLRNPGPFGIFFLVKGLGRKFEITDSIIICNEQESWGANNALIIVADPQLVYYKLMASLVGVPSPKKGIHPTAVVDAEANISPDAWIGPYCVIGNCDIAARVQLHSHVVVMDGSVLEEDVVIEPHSTIGATGVAWVWDMAARQRVMQPQTGYTVIGAGSFLGSDITVVRGSVNEATTVGKNCVIAHGSKIGHGSRIGDECHFANNISIAGNVTLGERCFLGAASVVRPQTTLASGIVVGAGAVVVSSFDEPNIVIAGVPAKKIQKESDRLSGVPKRLD